MYMKILIENNSFTMDTRDSRLTRLYSLKVNIENYASELSLSPELLEWALFAYDEFKQLLEEQIKVTNLKNEKFSLINNNEREFFQRFVSFREIIINQAIDDNLINELQLKEQMPTTRVDKIEFANSFLERISLHSAFTSNEVTSIIMQNLKNQLSIVRNSYGKALGLQEKSTNLTNTLNKRFDQDSVNLRTLFNWCVIFWNKKTPKLMDIGFTIPKSSANNPKTPEKINNFKVKEYLTTWDKDSKAENYQLVFRNKFDNVEWSELYFGKNNITEIILKSGEYKVRGFNEHGFGNWSDMLIFNENLELIKE